MRVFVVTLCFLGVTLGDVYLSNPRGSNNRLNEQSATRQNNNRLFDSQNNARGGYNTGDRTAQAAGNNAGNQYPMYYYASGANKNTEASKLLVEWTNQHGCGQKDPKDPHKTNCNIVIQMMCMDHTEVTAGVNPANVPAFKNFFMRDGTTTNTQNYNEPNKNEYEGATNTKNNAYNARMAGNYNNNQPNRGLHESVTSYDMCKFREANAGLYRADQNLAKNKMGYIDASRTRQNPGGTRRGYECPEERDYYPYWAPTGLFNTNLVNNPWIDLAYLSGDDSSETCNYIRDNSENQKPRSMCVLPNTSTRKYGKAISKEKCEEIEGAKFVEFHSHLEILENIRTPQACAAENNKDTRNSIKWMSLNSGSEIKKCVVQAPKPYCGKAPWTRVNHLGNAAEGNSQDDSIKAAEGEASRWMAELPYFPSGKAKRCVMRLRYNITTDEFDIRESNTDHRYNYDLNNDVISPAETNPYIDVAQLAKPLRLAMNTAQYGRTFQDRTHVFVVLPRTADMASKTLHNLNVRGKRGNIVQTFPAVEYDFVPNDLTVKEGDLVHIQWTGSNTHNNGPNGGDGQTGDAGEGTGGTDRNNILEMLDISQNYPSPFEKTTLWSKVKSISSKGATAKDIAVGFATSGYYCGAEPYAGCNHTPKTKGAVNNQLNNAPASYFGHVLEFQKGSAGKYVYMCTRNNNFTNRSQKGKIMVKA